MKFTKISGDDWEATYRSADERFLIHKRRLASPRNGHFNALEWKVVDTKTGQSLALTSFKVAKEHAQDILDEEAAAEPALQECVSSLCSLSYGEGTRESPDRCVHCGALFERDALIPFAFRKEA